MLSTYTAKNLDDALREACIKKDCRIDELTYNVLEENKIVAETITNTMKENMKNIREVKKENGYYMYSKIKVPGVLVEAGFVSNPNDNYKIRQSDYQDILIKNIAMGIETYFQVTSQSKNTRLNI